jgi:hypothetical protein
VNKSKLINDLKPDACPSVCVEDGGNCEKE